MPIKTEISETVSAIQRMPWALVLERMPEVLGGIVRRAESFDDDDEWEPLVASIRTDTGLEAAKLDVPRAGGAVAVVPIRGVISKGRDWWAGASTEEIGQMVGLLQVDNSVGAIVLAIDSPGGIVYGVPELADQIYGYRKAGKPVYTIADPEAGSAAYWIGSQASGFFVLPSGMAGSIGVWTAHMDVSKAFEEMGIKITLISEGRYKVEGNPWEPLSEEAQEAIQSEVREYYDMFTAAVARGRGATTRKVESGYGEGRMLTATRAIEENLVDGIATLDDLLGALLPRKRGSAKATATARIAFEEAGIDFAADLPSES